jgi:glycosyltransferase involved in cell wall biosynthesis
MQEYINKYGVPDSKIVLTRLGIDTQFFRPISHVDKLRISLQIPLEDPVILYSGFFTHRKGLEYLGRAMTKIHPTPWLVLTGKWDLSVHQKFYASLGSMSSRVIEAGFVPDERMPDYYSMADLYVSPSLLEGFGLPLIEALSCGTPVVGVDSGAVAEVVGPRGVLVPPADSQALAQAVSCLLSSPMKRKNLARQGRAHVVTNFGLERMVDTYIEAYKHFLYALSS